VAKKTPPRLSVVLPSLSIAGLLLNFVFYVTLGLNKVKGKGLAKVSALKSEILTCTAVSQGDDMCELYQKLIGMTSSVFAADESIRKNGEVESCV